MASTLDALIVGPRAVAVLHAAELPQKDNLCGCFWGAIALRAAGVEEVGGEPLDEDRVAVESRTALPEGDPDDFVPPGETSRQDYRLRLPQADDPAEGGTAAAALAEAVERLAEGRLAVLPVAGSWSADSVVQLVETVAASSPETLLVANVRTGAFWGTRPEPTALLAYLAGAEPDVPPADWDTGHFVNLAALVRAGDRALVLVRDSYRGLGWTGHHLQPAHAVAAALLRDDGREGGVLCIAPASDADALRERLLADGFELRHWDNGTPTPPTSTES